MSPSRRTTTYRPRRDRREVTIAVLVGAGILIFTALMVWVLGPHDSGSSNSPTTTTVPAAATTTTTPGSSATTPTTAAATTTTPAGGG